MKKRKIIDISSIAVSQRQIALLWSIADVQRLRPDLSDDQAWQVLESVEADHDAEVGVSFSTLQWAAFDLFGSGPDEDDEGVRE